MRPLYIFGLLFFVLHASAQNRSDSADAPKASFNIPATFPGGSGAWSDYLASRLRPATAFENGAPPGVYTVTVSFLVDTTGKVTEVQIIQDPGYNTAYDVLHAFKKAPKWIPATMNGRKVIYRQKQNFDYQVSEH